MKKKSAFPWKTVLADLAIVASCVPLILPHLAGAPAWVQSALAIGGIVVARLNGTGGGTAAGYRPSLPPGAGALLVLCLVPLLALSQGCASTWREDARLHVGVASRAEVAAEGLLEAHVRVACPSPDGAADCEHAHRFDEARAALQTARDAIRSGELALSRPDAGGDTAFRVALPCLAATADDVVRALVAAGVELPAWASAVAAAIVAYAGPCAAPPGGAP